MPANKIPISQAECVNLFCTTKQVDTFRSWIPIREKESPELPFDFAAERILSVPRLANEKLDIPTFEKGLEKALISILSNTNIPLDI